MAIQVKKLYGMQVRSFVRAIVLTVICSVGNCSLLYAGNYYVSPDGVASWGQCTVELSPCSAVTAMNNAVAGDTVFFRGGTYHLTGDPSNSTWTNKSSDSIYQGWLQPANSGRPGAYITFKAFPGEKPVMDASEQASRKEGRAFGTNGKDYIVFDGFNLICEGGLLAGGIVISAHDSGGSSDHCIIRNCEFDGGTQDIGMWGDNIEGVRAELANFLLVENSLFYNYVTAMWESGANTSCIKMYDTDSVTVTHCEFRDSSAGIYWKRNNRNMIASYNYLVNVMWPIHIAAGGAGPGDSVDGAVFHNVSVGYADPNSCVGSDSYWVHGVTYYNNTFYSLMSSELHDCELKIIGSDGVKVYNNIFAGSAIQSILIGENYYSIDEFDHNAFVPFKDIYTHLWSPGQKIFSSIGEWQSSSSLNDGSNPGSGSLALDINSIFQNSSGNLNTLADFRLKENSPCKGAGRGGVDMGADIAQVGLQDGSSQPPAKPAVPANFTKE